MLVPQTSFRGSELNLKDFLKFVDSIDLNVKTRERTRLRLFQFSLRDQASNWLERLPAGSISTWEDLTTRFLTRFFPPGRTFKLQNDILITPRRTIDQACVVASYMDKNDKESWALLEDLALYDNESWNDPRDFAKPVNAISMPHDVPSASDRRLIELNNQVQHMMKAHLAQLKPVQVNKIASSLKDSKPFDTLADLGSCVNLLPLKLFKELKVGLLKETDDVLGLADGTKSCLIRIVRNVEVHVQKLKLFEDFHVVEMEREPTCPLLVGIGFLATANAVIDCKKAKLRLGSIPINLKGNIWESEDVIENRIDWNRPPKGGDGAWHIRIELINPDGEKFDRLF
ncbi:MAK10-like protein [Tanacetum coccineum]|uniref:MAK10-like protein n=1 Tax=Tanacetum coccineum TaxID=301880 RepID=A0ABQ5EHT1_9ASTR